MSPLRRCPVTRVVGGFEIGVDTALKDRPPGEVAGSMAYPYTMLVFGVATKSSGRGAMTMTAMALLVPRGVRRKTQVDG